MMRPTRILVLTLLAGCRAAAPTPIGPGALRPLPPPNVTRMDSVVQDQIKRGHAQVEALDGQTGSPPMVMAEAYGELGRLLLAYRVDGAEAALANARDLAPEDVRWPYYLGRLHQEGGQFDLALTDYERARALRPDDIATLVRLAQVNLDLGRTGEAEARLDEVLAREPDHALAHALLGELASSGGDYAAAVEHLGRALALEPSATRLHYMLAIAYRHLGEAERSREHLARRGDTPVRMSDPLGEAIDGLKKGSGLLVNQAGIALQEGQVDAAIALYAKAIAEDPDDATAHLNLGAAYARQGDLRRAITEMETAARFAPDDAKVQQSLGTVLVRQRQAEKAEAALRRAMALDPAGSGARLVLADLLRRTGRCVEAVPLYAAGLERDPSQLTARVQQALCHGRLGQWREARALLEANATAFPDKPDAVDALARLLASAPDDGVRDGQRALELASQAVVLRRSVDTVETLAMARAELGQFAEAARAQREAIGLAEQGKYADWLAVLRANLGLYEQGQACRVPWPEFLFRL